MTLATAAGGGGDGREAALAALRCDCDLAHRESSCTTCSRRGRARASVVRHEWAEQALTCTCTPYACVRAEKRHLNRGDGAHKPTAS